MKSQLVIETLLWSKTCVCFCTLLSHRRELCSSPYRLKRAVVVLLVCFTVFLVKLLNCTSIFLIAIARFFFKFWDVLRPKLKFQLKFDELDQVVCKCTISQVFCRVPSRPVRHLAARQSHPGFRCVAFLFPASSFHSEMSSLSCSSTVPFQFLPDFSRSPNLQPVIHFSIL